jgi:hypothetical protein
VVGRSTRREVTAALGAPWFVSRYAPGAFSGEYDGRRFDLHTIVVRYRPDGVVDQIEQRYREPLARAQVVAALGLGQSSQALEFEGSSVEVFAGSGIELTVRRGSVTGLRMVSAASPARPPATAVGPVAAVPPTPTPKPRPTLPPAPGPAASRQVQRPATDTTGFRGGQRLRVRRVWYKADQRVGGETGLMVYADVAARGCKGKTMTAQVRLRHHDGTAVMAAASAPATSRDLRGRFAAPAPDQVLYDPASWSAYQVFVPYRHLHLPRGQAHSLVIVFTAACDGETNGVEELCSFRAP